MFDCQCMIVKKTNINIIFISLIICSIIDNLVNKSTCKKRNKNCSIKIQNLMKTSRLNLSLHLSSKSKKLLSTGSFFHSFLSEWSIHKTAAICLQNLCSQLEDVLKKPWEWNLWFYTNTWTVLLIKLPTLALVALLS